jgi:2-polyprenyl-3-methyl-5-hydroxy-6-metoxy-1,4-benzoquinol methylase
MVYVAQIAKRDALIFDGAVDYGYDSAVLTSSNLEDVKDSWEMKGFLSGKEAEFPALRRNAQAFLHKIDQHFTFNNVKPKILDFGSGWGFFLSEAKTQGWESHGLEPLPASSVYARAKFGLSITTDTLREGLYPLSFFDVITAFQVFEHLPYPQHDLHVLHGILKPRGLLLIEVPDIDTWTMKFMKEKHRHFVADHLNFFSAKTLSDFLNTNGFKVLESWHPSRYMSVRHLVHYWVRRFAPGLVSPAQRISRFLGLWESTISINLGDIVAVLARKQ